MAILKNKRHEKFALAIFKGSTQRAAATEAGYEPSRVDSTASELVRNRKVLARILELFQAAASDAIMSVRERKERLSEIARARLSDFIEIEEDGSIKRIDIKSGHSAALQEVTVTEFVGAKDPGDRERATKVKLHEPVKSIAELNRMEHIYELPSVIIKDIKVLVVREGAEGTKRNKGQDQESPRISEGSPGVDSQAEDS